MEAIGQRVLSSLPLVVSSVLLVVVLSLLLQNVEQKDLAGVPFIGKELGSLRKRQKQFVANGRNMMRAGYRQGKVFSITTQHGHVVMLTKENLTEVLKLPDEVLDMVTPVEIDFETKHTKLDSYQPIVPHSIRADLTPQLGRLVPQLWPEIKKIIQLEIPETDKPSAHNVNSKLLRIVSMAAGSAFVGTDLCYRDEWIDASIGYTVDVMGAGRSLKAWPAQFRGIAAKFDPLVRRSQEHRDAIKKFLGPVITERKANAGKPGWEKPDDMLQWMIDKSESFGIHDDEYMATVQLGVGLVSIHSTTITCTQALYDLASKPEYTKPLRDEISQALKDSNGIFTKEALYNCKLLDSFVKESQRLNPITMVIGKRILRQSITLTSGMHLPAGTRVAVPTEAVSNDPENYPEPEKFDGYRFVKLRSAKEGVTSQYHQFVTANKTSLNFGYGKHACPGRFFAAAEIKMILAYLLINYDFELENGPERPANMIHGDSCVPDMRANLLFKKAAPF